MSTLGLAIAVAGMLLIYWAIGGGSLDITTGQPKAAAATGGSPGGVV